MVRWIMHKVDGKTIISDWDGNNISFRKNWSRDITSLQLQTDDKKLYTLSSGRRKNPIFWQTDDFICGSTLESKMICRKILKNICNDIWLVLTLQIETGICNLSIINKRIKI